MTSKYSAYLAMMAARDSNLTMLALLALGFVVAWLSVDWMPFPIWIRHRIKGIYQAGGLVLYMLVMLITMLGGH